MWLILSLILVLPSPALMLTPEQQPEAWLTDYQEALHRSHSQSKPVLMVFAGSDWCRPCMQLSREIWQSEDFQRFADERLVLLYLDFPRSKKNRLSPELQSQNDQLAERYNPDGLFPLLLLLDPQEQVLHRSGYLSGGPEIFIREFSPFLHPAQP